MDILYTAHATASGGGRNGRSATDDGKIDVSLSVPRPKWAARTAPAPTRNSCSRPVTPPATSAPCVWSPGKAGTPVGPDTKVHSGIGFGKNTRGEGFNLAISPEDHRPRPGQGGHRRPDPEGPPGLPLLQRHARQRRRRPVCGITRRVRRRPPRVLSRDARRPLDDEPWLPLLDATPDPLLTLEPHRKVSVRELFGVDSDMKVPVFDTATATCPTSTRPTGSIRRPRWPSAPASPTTAA